MEGKLSLLWLLLLIFTSCSAQSTYYVTPTPDTPCPGEPCHTLSQYVTDQYFNNITVNTTMEFLPGNYTLNQTISVTNLTSLTLLGDSSSLLEITSTIVCTWPAGFVFTGITELHVNSLAFISCGHSDSAAVNIISVHQSNISNCSFYNSTNTNQSDKNDGGALHIQNSDVLLTGNIFQNNTADVGGVIFVRDSNLTVTDNTFKKNSADLGGVLYVEHSTLTVIDNTFLNNFAGQGGVLLVEYSTLTITSNTFQNNVVVFEGGVFHVWDSDLTVGDNTFTNNSADANTSEYRERGGVFYVHHSTLTVTDNTFQSNSAYDDGGVLYVEHSTLTVIDNTFLNNFAGHGGVLLVDYSTLNITDNTFQNNSAEFGGGVLFVDNTFQNNSADGGALYVRHSPLTLMITGNTFKNNLANLGGTIYMVASSVNFADNNFTDSSAELGGAIFITDNSLARMYGSNIIENNRAQYGGGIASLDSQLQLLNTIFENNTAIYGGGLYARNTKCNGNALFIKNLASEGGGGIYASRSKFFWTENTTIIKNNSAMDGGGLLLSDDSKLYLQPNIAVHLISNRANRTGGAIKVEECNPLTYCILFRNGHDVSNSDCFFQIQSQLKQDLIHDDLAAEFFFDHLNVKHIMIHFDNNSAIKGGTDLYGGNVDSCTLDNIKLAQYYSGRAPSRNVFNVITSSGNKPIISSDPLNICTCVDNLTNCTGSYHPEPVYPGGTLEIPVIAQGQRNGTTVAIVQAIAMSNINVSNLEISQNILNSCTPLEYTIQSRAVDTTQKITLYAEGPCLPTETNTLTVTVDILPCPPGFQLSETQPSCICTERLQQFTNSCCVDNGQIHRMQHDEFWVGYDNRSEDIILHPHCPFDYCTSEETYFAVDDSDTQCNYNRSGLLCGTCSEYLSLALGSSRCLQCSNSYFSLLVVFAFIGIALVFLLLVLRLTVATGTINGLILYANIMAVNSAIFFQPPATNILKVFIAWLNLDLGIETCFYNGMDAYVKTWLQFAFPLYVWALVGMIIIGSHYSGKVAKVFGSNPVAVLATLFLLSYAKVLRTVNAALSYTFLEYPNNSHTAVWLYDGNVRYLNGKHIPLFMVALACLAFLFFPYMMLLIFSQWLQANWKFKMISWINSPKVKFFLDTYHAPYTDKHRYWTGLLLFLRFILYLIVAVNALGDPSVNLLAISSITVAILTLTTLTTRIYKSWSLCLLETSFILNLTILAVATLYIHLTGGNQNPATFTSVSVAFATFIGIVIYHSVEQIKDTRRVYLRRNYMSLNNVNPRPENQPDVVPMPGSTPTQTVIDIRDSELREPCMETDRS